MGLDLIYILKAIFIAIIEGLTEFVPVSSTGHMILFGSLIGFNSGNHVEFAKMFEVVIQLGAILAVVVLYWGKLWYSIVEFFTYIFTLGKKGEKGFRFGINVIIASIPAGVVGLLLHDKIKALFKPSAVVVAFIVGGVLLLVIENRFRNKVSKKGNISTTDVFDLTPMQSLKVGLFQVLSMWPGMSRSASTIMGGWIAGLSTPVAAEFSFFLAIPAMVGSTGLDLLKFDFSIMNKTYIIALIVGFVVAFIVSLVVMEMFVSYLKKKPMRVFAIYRIIAGIVLLILSVLGIVSLVV
ncbi:undecaprenyl-diphosphate phosphatase [Clostridium septicum]|uniref:Undecaprenyl-diphosphatase n=1 Tax=Clostridium septicum TaxID=1504 RepID=A0A9N7JN06_CLOSE|nr:undecaprenyl-diphosphate phosphatase [Clostridium septicum]AYE35433.1 undecaprenyl-diphosphate phosphatase [Clostridium septicum]MDU1314887.1 undecaprenyl-diphosphate phosphatase [Clostridium septicum]QAS60821.1 undecaprenyl-diphosphate phosphatase [Clostridium septicum]UEC19910.1 undecaprenyl-diphosphate phosphatase [Clostridium septicum]USS02030.1 undecaprenyl-diphosphate phosphatase [Clostridium septicum]